MEQQVENKITEELEKPVIKYIKLKNGESIVAMVEFGKDEDSGQVKLYSPFRVIIIDLIEAAKNERPPFIIEEWLPSTIVSEQCCVIVLDDVITMVDINDRFTGTYTRSVIKKNQIEELLRTREIFGRDKTRNDMELMEEESGENSDEELTDKIDELLKNFPKRYN
jgi:hypothetical protein